MHLCVMSMKTQVKGSLSLSLLLSLFRRVQIVTLEASTLLATYPSFTSSLSLAFRVSRPCRRSVVVVVVGVFWRRLRFEF